MKKLENKVKIYSSKCLFEKIILMLPVLWGMLIVTVYGVNIISWDEWSIIDLIYDFKLNGFSFLKLFSQHNEHRIFFPKIILLISGILSNYNVKLQMYISQVGIIIVYSIYIRYIKKIDEEGERVKGNKKYSEFNWINMFIIVIGFSCFSAIQYENFLWGFQVGFLLVLFSGVVSLYYFYKGINYNRKIYFVISCIMGIVSSFSSLQGLLVWIVILIILGLLTFTKVNLNNKNDKFGILILFISALLSWIFYFIGYNKVAGHPDILSSGIIEFVKYFLVSIGSIGAFSNKTFALSLGLLILILSLILFIYILFKNRIKESIFPLALLLFGYAVLFTISIGRSGFGISQALSSRYTSFGILIFIGLILLFYNEFYLNSKKCNKLFKIIVYFVASIIGLAVLTQNIYQLKYCELNKEQKIKLVKTLTNYQKVSLDELKWIYPFPSYEEAYRLINILEENHLNVFSVYEPLFCQLSSSILENKNELEFNGPIGFDENTIKVDEKFLCLSGWAIDYINETSYSNLFIKINGRLYKSDSHLNRPDVAEYFNNEKYTNSGFNGYIRLDNPILNRQENVISVIVVLQDGNSYYESNKLVVDGINFSIIK